MQPASRGRDALFSVQCGLFVAMMGLLGPVFFPLSAGFGMAGVGVLVLTLAAGEPLRRKAWFLMAGGAGTAALLTLSVFHVLVWIGHPPGGDGGGITVPMLLVVCPAVFLVGAAGVAFGKLIAAGSGSSDPA